MNAPVIIGLVKGDDYVIEFANEGLLEVWGRTSAVIGKPLVEAIPELRDQGFTGLLDEVRHSGNPFYAYEYPITLHRQKGPEVLYFDFVYKPFFEPTDTEKASGVISVGHDVTERVLGRKKLQEITDDLKVRNELIESQNTLIKTLTDNATSTLFMMNDKGYCTFMNAAGEKMFGYSQEEIRSMPLHYLIHHHRPDGSLYPMEECPLDRALPDNFDVRAHRDLFFRKDGTSFPVSCAASPIFENGVPVSTVIEVRDISLELEAEQSLKRSAAELEQLVQERTSELKSANEQLKEFTYAASHDLQEPLRKIRVFREKLLANIGPLMNEESWRISGKIEETIERMQALIDDLLVYANTSHGSGRSESVDLNETVRGVLSDMETTIAARAATVNIQTLPTVLGDPLQYRQLFQNLISNAIKYQPADQVPLVTLYSRRVTPGKEDKTFPVGSSGFSYHHIQVADNGIGFSQDDAGRIFGLFNRLHDRSAYPGTGIGLSIVQKVVENHKGFIWADSVPGKGTIFNVLLPVAEPG